MPLDHHHDNRLISRVRVWVRAQLDHLPMSYVIQCLIPMNDNQPLSEYNKLNATKVGWSL